MYGFVTHRLRRLDLLAALAAFVFLNTPGSAQVLIQKDQPDLNITPQERKDVIDGLLKRLNENYIFPDKARAMEQAIRARQEKKEYDGITSAKEFADTLSKQLQEVCHDKHLHLVYSHDPHPRKMTPDPAMKRRMHAQMEKMNFGFEKVERLEGNIGYLELRGFMDAEAAGPTAAAAMSLLAHTDALIIDLRQNGGGTPGMVALLCSYFFDGPPRHLNDFHFRRASGEEIQQWWTLPYVPGQRYVDKAVYILTSKRTFSAAEEFTYDLQAQKRATVVGEATGGGAHPIRGQPLTDHFGVIIPTGQAINPVTKSNWEGTGVKADIQVPASEALKTAHLTALKKLLDKKDIDPMQKHELEEAIQRVTSREKRVVSGER
jgi:hypothetical protein